MEKPSSEFFATLGQYVYQYIDSEGKVYYTGKGNGDRCWSHVVEKDFNPDQCYIVARNLEKFENKKDWQSFLLESYLISTLNPEGNSVAGHYKECFVMVALSSMFKEYVSDQYNMFAAFPDWYVKNFERVFDGKLREVNFNSTTAYFLSNARNKMYMMWWWSPNSSDPTKITFEIKAEGKDLASQKATMCKWLKENGFDETFDDGKPQKLAVFSDSIEDVVTLFEEFMK